MDIGKRIRAERKAQGLSQDVLARRADVNLAVINRLERGASTNPHTTTLVAIADALGVPVGALLEESVDPKDLASFSGADTVESLIETNERFLRAQIEQLDPKDQEEIIRRMFEFWGEQLKRLGGTAQPEVTKVIDELTGIVRESYRIRLHPEQDEAVETGDQR
jgi:transcriptional regulator with XRE-family HTH domain